MPRKITKKGYKSKCDTIFALIIRLPGKCERCGSKSGLQCAHVISRKNLVLRWDIRNGLCLCLRCHLYWAHKNPLEFADWYRQKYPVRYEYLMKRKNEIVKMTLEDYKELYARLEGTWASR